MTKSITTSEQVQKFVDARQPFINFEVVTSIVLKNKWSTQELTLPASESELERVLDFIETEGLAFENELEQKEKARQVSGGDARW
jgi:hypothetical protein